MRLIKATLNQLDQLTEMNIQLRTDEKIDNIMSDDEVRTRMQGFLEGDEYVAYLMEDDMHVYGYSLIKITSSPTYLRQIFIKPAYRNQGLGKKFIAMLINTLSLPALDVEALIWNERAIRFYEEFGFERRYVGLRYHS